MMEIVNALSIISFTLGKYFLFWSAPECNALMQFSLINESYDFFFEKKT